MIDFLHGVARTLMQETVALTLQRRGLGGRCMATEKRLIDANELVSYLWVLFKFFGSLPCSEVDKATQRAIKRCIGEVKKMPTVDAVEVVHGRWIPTNCECDGICSVCNTEFDNYTNDVFEDWNYCPNCGAKMDGDGNG